MRLRQYSINPVGASTFTASSSTLQSMTSIRIRDLRMSDGICMHALFCDSYRDACCVTTYAPFVNAFVFAAPGKIMCAMCNLAPPFLVTKYRYLK